MDTNFHAEFSRSKAQLKEFLGRTFLDSSLLLGFVTINQQGFQKVIIDDFNKYYKYMEVDEPQNHDESNLMDLEFETIKYVEALWTEFHYPIIKYFQSQHAECFANVSRSYKTSQLEGRKFVVKPVEMRKINENFTKYLKQVNQFYRTLLKHFLTNFQNPLLPNLILKFFNYEVAQDALSTSNASVQANILYLTHKFLLFLGDLSRHRNSTEISYVTPCSSHKEFFKSRELANKEKTLQLRPSYEKALQLYKFCILLLPALNEPYNHIGMIYNLIDDKFNSCLWFLRSQFTRLPDYQLGLANLNNILGKKWFLTHLVDIDFDETPQNKKGKFSFNSAEELNVTLICLVCYFYLPSVYKRGPNVVKRITFSKLESDFFKVISNSFDELLVTRDEFGGSFFVKQLTVIFCFYQLIVGSSIESSPSEELATKFSRFTFRYVEKIFEGCNKLKFNDNLHNTNYLVTLRFILNWIRENKVVFRVFQTRFGTLERMASMLNSLLSHVDSIKCEAGESQDDQRINRITDSLKSSSRPTRAFYFHEDVFFRDCSIIKYQFKDFKDDHLFLANNINLLVGDYSGYLQNSGIPTFLDNETINRIKQNTSSQDKKELIFNEIENYENDLRIIATLVLGKRLLERNTFFITFDADTHRFLVDKSKNNGKTEESIEIDDSQNLTTAQILRKAPKAAKKMEILKRPTKVGSGGSSPVSESNVKNSIAKHNVQVENTLSSIPNSKKVAVLSSLEEIESVIASHTIQLVTERDEEKVEVADSSVTETFQPLDTNNESTESITSSTQPGQVWNTTDTNGFRAHAMHSQGQSLLEPVQQPNSPAYSQYSQYMPTSYNGNNFNSGSTPYNVYSGQYPVQVTDHYMQQMQNYQQHISQMSSQPSNLHHNHNINPSQVPQPQYPNFSTQNGSFQQQPFAHPQYFYASQPPPINQQQQQQHPLAVPQPQAPSTFPQYQ